MSGVLSSVALESDKASAVSLGLHKQKEGIVMSQKIILEPSEVWEYYQSNKNEFKSSMSEIASCDEYGISVYLSENEKGNPCIVVEADDSEVCSENVVSESDCKNTVQKIYDKYLTDKVVEVLSDLNDDDDSLLEQEDAISEREDELDTLVYEFVMGVLGGEVYFDGCEADDMLDDMKEHFLEYMARKHGLPIFRPMVLEDEDGEDFFEEFPYECMEFDDENNPI